jgi:hypothetical protein
MQGDHGKGKVVPLLKHHAMKAYGGMKVLLNTFLILTLDGGEWSFSFSGCFTTSTRWIGGGVGPTHSWSQCSGEEKSPCPYQAIMI